MAKIRYSATSAGTDPHDFAVNPFDWEIPEGYGYSAVKVLHGGNAWQGLYFDSRPRSLVWSGLYATATYDQSGFTTFFSTMQSWVGTAMFFQFQSMDDMNYNWPTDDSWKRVRVVDLKVRYRSALQGGIPQYDRVELIIQPEQS